MAAKNDVGSAGVRLSVFVLQLFGALMLTAVLVGYGYVVLVVMLLVGRPARYTSDQIVEHGIVFLVVIVSHMSAQLMVKFADYLLGKMTGMSERAILRQVMWVLCRELSLVVVGLTAITCAVTALLGEWFWLAVVLCLLVGASVTYCLCNRSICSTEKKSTTAIS